MTDDAIRTAAQHSLLAYAMLQWQPFRDAQHHRKIAAALEAVAAGKIKRLMIFMPPRHGKSLLCSEMFPAWYLGQHPDKYIVCATYGQELADDFGRKVRNQMQSDEYNFVFPDVQLRADSASAKRFHTQQGGSYFAVGVGGPLTGRGAHVMLVDDPIRNRADADSELKRRRIQDWYTSVAYTRLMPGGAIICIQTRWHDADLAGWLLTEHAHEDWTVISLPAISETGDALWHDQYPLEVLHQIRDTLGQRDWSALYQQEPIPDTGGYFQRDWLRFYDISYRPVDLRVYGASDYAVTADGGDHTEHGVFGVDQDDNIYVLDWWHGQTSADVWIEKMLDLSRKWQPVAWFGEAGVIQKSVEPFLLKRMRERRDYMVLRWLPSIHDKPTRARGIQARCSMGKLLFPEDADFTDRVTAQMLRFPGGTHDDAVDVLGLIGRALEQIRGNPVQVIKPRVSRIDERLQRLSRSSANAMRG